MARDTAAGAKPGRKGRPSLAMAESIDRAVLDAAWASFIESGFQAATMAEIARRAGVTKATLYARHAGKVALLEAVIADRLRRWSLSAPKVDRTAALPDKLRRYARVLMERSREPEVVALNGLLRSGEGMSLASERRMQARLRAPMLQQIAEDITMDAAADGKAAVDPHRLAAMFMGLLMGFDLEGRDEEGSLGEAFAYADACVDLFLAAHLHNQR